MSYIVHGVTEGCVAALINIYDRLPGTYRARGIHIVLLLLYYYRIEQSIVLLYGLSDNLPLPHLSVSEYIHDRLGRGRGGSEDPYMFSGFRPPLFEK